MKLVSTHPEWPDSVMLTGADRQVYDWLMARAERPYMVIDPEDMPASDARRLIRRVAKRFDIPVMIWDTPEAWLLVRVDQPEPAASQAVPTPPAHVESRSDAGVEAEARRAWYESGHTPDEWLALTIAQRRGHLGQAAQRLQRQREGVQVGESALA